MTPFALVGHFGGQLCKVVVVVVVDVFPPPPPVLLLQRTFVL